MVFSGSFHTFNFACITASWRTLRKIKTDMHAAIILWPIARILWTHFFCRTICCILSVCIRNSGGFIFARTKTTRCGRTEANGIPGCYVHALMMDMVYVGDSTNGICLTYALLAWCSRARSILSILPV